jgi:DNA-binding FrmR family transcriptional regulator
MLHGDEKRKMTARVRRIEGQVAAIGRMLEEEQYCVEVLTQIAAAEAALAKVGSIVLARHMECCVTEAFENGSAKDRREKIEELMEIFHRYTR